MTTEAPPQYCSQLSMLAGESMLGTSPQVDFWILLEFPGRWEAKALVNNDLPEEVQSWLAETPLQLSDAGRKPRVQFIRQRRKTDEGLHVFVGEGTELRQLVVDDVNELTSVDLTTDVTTPVDENQYFVCTNGARDVCCSRFGLPTWRELESLTNGRAWHTTHLGGHRYAPNVLVLPHGRLYGRVHPDDVAEFYASVEAGEIATRFLRGRSEFDEVGQACEALVDCPVRRVLESCDDNVKFSTENGEILVQAPGRDHPLEVIASCGDETTTTVYPFNGI